MQLNPTNSNSQGKHTHRRGIENPTQTLVTCSLEGTRDEPQERFSMGGKDNYLQTPYLAKMIY